MGYFPERGDDGQRRVRSRGKRKEKGMTHGLTTRGSRIAKRRVGRVSELGRSVLLLPRRRARRRNKGDGWAGRLAGLRTGGRKEKELG